MLDVFDKREKLLLVAAALFTVVWGFFTQLRGPYGGGDLMYRMVEWGPLALASLIGLYWVFKVTRKMGGRAGRAVSVVGVGYLLFAILSIPHAMWHGEGTVPGFFGLGLSVGGLDIFFHVTSGFLFLFMTYGFYLAYRAAVAPAEGGEL